MTDLEKYYRQQLQESKQLVEKIRQQLAIGSAIRLLIFLLIAFSVYRLFHAFAMEWMILLALSIIGFLGMISWYVNKKEAENYQSQLCFLYENELGMLNGSDNQLDDGSGFDDALGASADLDLFGNKSLFHLMNRCVTSYGKESLASRLNHHLTDRHAILAEQMAIQQWAKQITLVESVTAKSLLYQTGYENFDSILDWLNSPNHLQQNKWARFIRFALPAFNLILIAWVIAGASNAYLSLVFVLGWLQIAVYAKYFQKDFNLLSKKEAILKQYAHILSAFEQIDPADSFILQSMKERAAQAHFAIESLSKISNRIDQRLNIFLITLVNPVLLYDIQNMFALEAWKIKYQQQLPDWILLVGEIERLNSFAFYAYNHPENNYPQPIEGASRIIAESLRHPLIAKQNCVPNDLNVGTNEKLLLITGSNMSGKTTFLRTVGVNLILAQMGLPVCAKSFQFTPMKIFSSIRISDSLQENTSYFMAELKKLKTIKNGVQENKASLVLIDEILRGTNSEDKFYGSSEFIKAMIAMNCISLFATHDLQLSELENEFPDQISNYCFESVMEENELIFSYQIQRGVAKNRNASFLMKKMGII